MAFEDEWVAIVYELWPQAVGVRAGWASCPADRVAAFAELVGVYVPAYRRLAVEASRRGWSRWPSAWRRHAELYAECGDAREMPQIGGYVAGLCVLRYDRPCGWLRWSSGRVIEAFERWEGLSLADRQAMVAERRLEPCHAIV